MQNGFDGETDYDGNGTDGSFLVTDVNGDGVPDIVVVNGDVVQPELNYNPGDVTILLGRGDGTFEPGVTYALPVADEGFYPGGPVDATTADLTGNGRQDIILSNTTGTVTILPNEGDGVFGAGTVVDVNDFSDGVDSPTVVAADINGDGLPDLLVGGGAASSPYIYKDDNGVSLALNNGRGGFDAPVTVDQPGSDPDGLAVSTFTTADVNGDGRADLLVLLNSPYSANEGGGGGAVQVFLNNDDGGFHAPSRLVIAQPDSGSDDPLGATAFAVGDVTGDGAADIEVSASSSNGDEAELDVFVNDGHGGYGAPLVVPLIDGIIPSSVTISDVNGDGRPDLVIDGYVAPPPIGLVGSEPPITSAYAPRQEIVLNEGGGAFSTPTLNDSFDGAVSVDLNGDGKPDLVSFGPDRVTPAGETDTISVVLATGEPAVCYAAGTRILTRQGEVAVEALREGDEVVTLLRQGFAKVKWLGHHRINLRMHPNPRAVQPVRILAGAFGPGQPARDLRVSPGHALYVDGVLIQAERLVNGATIRREAAGETVVYWHVELDRHDVLMAEGMPAESYLNTGNRTAFVGGGDYVQLHPDFAPKHWAETCAPLMQAGPLLEAVKARLLRRAREGFGWQVSEEHGLHVLADGVVIHGDASADAHRFALPVGCHELRLVSRRWVPAEMLASSVDVRELGVCVRRLALDGRVLSAGDASLSDGWHEPERDEHGAKRWTTGSAALPVGAQSLVVYPDGLFCTWSRPSPLLSAQSA